MIKIRIIHDAQRPLHLKLFDWFSPLQSGCSLLCAYFAIVIIIIVIVVVIIVVVIIVVVIIIIIIISG